MKQTVETAFKGGRFLVDDVDSHQIVTPDDVTDEHRLIAKTTEEFVIHEVTPKLRAIEQHDFQQAIDLFRQAGELGLLGADVPERYGGIGLDQLSSAFITEKFARAEGFAVAHNIHVGVGTLPFVYFGNERQKQMNLPSLAAGQKIAAYALTESGSGSDALAAKTTAVLNEEGTHYYLSGEKQWITNASIADIFVVFAKVDGKGLTAFIVDRNVEGVATGPEEKKMGIHSCSTATLILDEAKVPHEKVLGEIGKGHVVALNILNLARYKLAVAAVGQAKRACQLAAQYANERKQFQTTLASFPLIQEKLANMAVKIYAAESAVYRTAGLLEAQLAKGADDVQNTQKNRADCLAENLIECSVSKFFATDLLDQVVDEAVQIHGGYGFMQEYEIETMYRDARINRIFEGTNEINRLAVGHALIKKTRKNELFQGEKTLSWQAVLQKEPFEDSASQQTLLTKEKDQLNKARRLLQLAFETALQTYGDSLEGEQEMLASFANIVSEIYAMDSVIKRTEKSSNGREMDQNAQRLLLAEVFCHESMERIILQMKRMMGRMVNEERLENIYASFHKFTCLTPVDCIEKKRKIAANVLEHEAYVVK